MAAFFLDHPSLKALPPELLLPCPACGGSPDPDFGCDDCASSGLQLPDSLVALLSDAIGRNVLLDDYHAEDGGAESQLAAASKAAIAALLSYLSMAADRAEFLASL